MYVSSFAFQLLKCVPFSFFFVELRSVLGDFSLKK